MKRFAKGMKRTKECILSPLRNVLSADSISDESVEEIEEILLSADIGINASERIVRAIREKYKGGRFSEDECIKLLTEELMNIVDEVPEPVLFEGNPRVIVVVGVNGVGKTSTIGKLAYKFKLEGKKVLLAACDTFRAAAIDQLELWAERAGVPVVKQRMGADAAAVAYDAVKSAIARGMDIVMIDTAGRLHTNMNLMNELGKVVRVVSGKIEETAVETWLILDANMGQNSIRQAETFVDTLPVTGLILTKLDSSAKGGAIIPIQKKLHLPVLYVGVGEQIEDIELFDPEEFIRALTGNRIGQG